MTGSEGICNRIRTREPSGLFDFDSTYDDLGPGAQIACSDFNHGNPGLVGGAVLANEFLRLPYQLLSLAPPYVPSSLGSGGISSGCGMRTSGPNLSCLPPHQECPILESRVQVDPRLKDYWGIPVARLSGGEASSFH